MKRLLLSGIVVAALIASGWVFNDRARFDRAAWLADFAQLRQATEQSYANLRWSRTSKHVDLVALNAAGLQELQHATSNSAARRAVGNFVAGFHDGHFHVVQAPPRPVMAVLGWFEREPSVELDLKSSGTQACRALGFAARDHELAVTGAAPLPHATFAAGLLTTRSGRKFGILRIPLFQQREYGAICETAWEQFRAGKSGVCDAQCQDDFEVHAKQEIAQALADDAIALERSGAEAVVVDLTANGGGTEWAEYAAAALTAHPLRPQTTAFVRGRHWLKHFAEDLQAVDAELAAAPESARAARLRAMRADLLAMRDSAARHCDLSGLWTARDARPACWNDVPLAPNVHPPEAHRYARPYDGPLYIMTDAGTASASEQFAALLIDNGVARTIGEKTMGVGCGYTNGGNPTVLKHSGLVIEMPDCARLRADGSNEFEGITPDYAAHWGDDRASRTAALLTVLERLPGR